jgi:prophage regulatory protein
MKKEEKKRKRQVPAVVKFPSDQTLLRREVVMALADLKRTALDDAMANGDFPRPIKLTDHGRAVRWVESEVLAWLEQRKKARVEVQKKAVM